jgi:acetylornithine deacetylase/succinyl-diaminopimelate desuccinylase-like protein
MISIAPVGAYVRRHQRRFIRELQEFIRIPSVSSDPAHAADVRRCARWLARQLAHIGLSGARTIPTKRHPIVYGEWHGAAGRPTVLIYGHYDVQPAGAARATTKDSSSRT